MRCSNLAILDFMMLEAFRSKGSLVVSRSAGGSKTGPAWGVLEEGWAWACCGRILPDTDMPYPSEHLQAQKRSTFTGEAMVFGAQLWEPPFDFFFEVAI